MAKWLGSRTRNPEVTGSSPHSDHLAGVVSWWTLVQLLGHACK